MSIRDLRVISEEKFSDVDHKQGELYLVKVRFGGNKHWLSFILQTNSDNEAELSKAANTAFRAALKDAEMQIAPLFPK